MSAREDSCKCNIDPLSVDDWEIQYRKCSSNGCISAKILSKNVLMYLRIATSILLVYFVIPMTVSNDYSNVWYYNAVIPGCLRAAQLSGILSWLQSIIYTFSYNNHAWTMRTRTDQRKCWRHHLRSHVSVAAPAPAETPGRRRWSALGVPPCK